MYEGGEVNSSNAPPSLPSGYAIDQVECVVEVIDKINVYNVYKNVINASVISINFT